jgi:hypothetical protein
VIEVTRYARHLPDWRARFGQDRVLVLLNDDLRADPQAYCRRYLKAFITARGARVPSGNDGPGV